MSTDEELCSARHLRRLHKAMLSGAQRRQAEHLAIEPPLGFVDVRETRAMVTEQR